jgi:hypothetical protein
MDLTLTSMPGGPKTLIDTNCNWKEGSDPARSQASSSSFLSLGDPIRGIIMVNRESLPLSHSFYARSVHTRSLSRLC